MTTEQAKESEAQKSTGSMFRKFVFSCFSGIIQFITLPAQALRAVFYVPVLEDSETNGNTMRRGFFSITRAMFVIAGLVGIWRLLFGGMEVGSFAFGPDVFGENGVNINLINNTINTNHTQTNQAKLGNQRNMVGTGKQVKRRGVANRHTKQTQQAVKRKRIWFSVTGFKSASMNTSELLFILMLGCFYFFRKHLQKGDTTGDDSWLAKLATAGLAYKGFALQPIQPLQTPAPPIDSTPVPISEPISQPQQQPVPNRTPGDEQMPTVERGIG